MADPDKSPKTNTSSMPAKKSGGEGKSKPPYNTIMDGDSGATQKAASGQSKAGKVRSAPKSANGISKSAAMALALISALAGGAIGWIGPAVFNNTGETTLALQNGLVQVRADIDAASQDRTALRATQSGLESNLKSQAADLDARSAQISAQQESLAAADTDLQDQLTALDARLNALTAIAGLDVEGEDGQARQDDIAAFWARIEELETRNSVPDELAAKIEALETEMNALRLSAGNTAFPKPAAAPVGLPAVETAQDRKAALNILIDSFPRKTMLEAVRAQEVRAAEKPSLLKRTLGKVVRVRDEDAPDPEAIISSAEEALKRGEVTQSVSLLGGLNPPVRAVAAEWIEAAKKAAPSIENTP